MNLDGKNVNITQGKRRRQFQLPAYCDRTAAMNEQPANGQGDAAQELVRLLEVMVQLRDPTSGCPWDRDQTFDTIAPYTIEEAYEVADAIARRDFPELRDELGDLLLQVVYHSRMAEEGGRFGFADVARAIGDKMIRRHPHVFGGADGFDWEEEKQRERVAKRQSGTLDGIPAALPALVRAQKIAARAARVGFDWPNAGRVLDKLEEEIGEVRAELADDDAARLTDEVGDLLFVVANLARKLGLDAETCLRHANEKFVRRFAAVEARVAAEGLAPGEVGLAGLEAHWQAVKADESEEPR